MQSRKKKFMTMSFTRVASEDNFNEMYFPFNNFLTFLVCSSEISRISFHESLDFLLIYLNINTYCVTLMLHSQSVPRVFYKVYVTGRIEGKNYL